MSQGMLQFSESQEEKTMYTACAAVVFVVLVTVFMYMRAGHKNFAIAVIPLTFVPAMHLLTGLIGAPEPFHIGTKGWMFASIALDLAALLAALLLLLHFAQRIVSRGSRKMFIIISILFSCALTGILVSDLIGQLVRLY